MMRLLEFYTLESLDFSKLMEVYRESNEDNVSYFYPEETDLDKGRHLVEQKFYDYLRTGFYNKPGNRYYALENNGEWLSAIRLFPVEGKDNTFFAEALETMPSHRRKGYARKMMELLFEKLGSEGFFEITDTVNKSNEASLRFHLNCGFEIYKDPACCVLNGNVDEKAYTMRYVGNLVTVTSDIEKYAAFARKINADKDYSQPLLDSNLIEDKLDRAIHNTDDRVLAVIENGDITGLFVLLVIDDEKYVEITMGLSKSKEAYTELFEYLSQYFNGYQIDFSFNPCNEILRNILKEKSAVFRVEQQKMVLKRIPETTDMSGIESIDGQYTDGYLAIHDTSNYWTGERVLEEPDRFYALVAVEEHKVVGYLDLTKNYDENEPYDVFVREECRRKGYGKKLLAKAIELNKPKGMSLMVDVDNVPAIRLYTSMGFEKVENQNCVYATWQV